MSGWEDKATVTGRISGRSLALSGGSCSGDRMPTGDRKISCSVGGSWLHGAVTGRISDLSRCVPGWAKREQNSTQNSYFVNRTAQRFHFHPAHGGGI